MNLSYIIGHQGNITLFGGEGGRPINVPATHQNYRAIIELLKDPYALDQDILDLADLPMFITRKYGDRVEIVNGSITCDGMEFNNLLTQRILEFAEQDLPVEPLIKFLERVSQNPSNRAVNELYDFLEHRQLPLTPNGTFIAYKAVRTDYYDKFSGTILNEVGATISIPRNRVDDDRNRGCSHGLHVGTYDYAVGYGGSNSLMLIAEVDPADVVSVPTDCNCQKLRTCKYKVLKVVEMPINEVFWEGDEGDDFFEPEDVLVEIDDDDDIEAVFLRAFGDLDDTDMAL